MGYIHNTGSEIFGIETRSESAFLCDPSEGQHLFLPTLRATSIRDQIVRNLMEKAGSFYANGDTKQAEEYRKFADVIKAMPFDNPRYYSFEVSYEWLRDAVRFIKENNVGGINDTATVATEIAGENSTP